MLRVIYLSCYSSTNTPLHLRYRMRQSSSLLTGANAGLNRMPIKSERYIQVLAHKLVALPHSRSPYQRRSRATIAHTSLLGKSDGPSEHAKDILPCRSLSEKEAAVRQRNEDYHFANPTEREEAFPSADWRAARRAPSDRAQAKPFFTSLTFTPHQWRQIKMVIHSPGVLQKLVSKAGSIPPAACVPPPKQARERGGKRDHRLPDHSFEPRINHAERNGGKKV
ncbi:hypothetical protein QBC38DRAFT_86420 [Podospora fimiseda]|uniref:Uncharacterized protein n=1 Tax=Podospora fimiseda TaxID=252190 RepID=A0AAN6YN64_9PEZI|nr:hypothetical protein QBC38DRAFT_86420 [Podospora fimiseda]